MKKLFLVTLFFLSFFILKAQKIVFSYHFDAPIIKKLDNNFQLLAYPNSMQLAKVGNPSLPYIPVKLLLPPGTEATSIEIEYKNPASINGKINLYPKQDVKPLNEDPDGVLKINDDVYNSKIYPATRKAQVRTQYMNGYAFALSKFTPIIYYPDQKKGEYYTTVVVTVNYKQTTKAKTALNNLSSRPEVLARVKSFADNPKMADNYPGKKFNFDDYEMLIITGDSYINDFDDIIQSHFKRGIRCKVVGLSEIYSSMNGVDNPEKIRNYIIQEYQNHNIEFVMLGGDADVVPFRGLYCEALSGGQTYSDDLPADVYFSALDGTWNDDGDNHWGEPDEDDLLPDVAVGRLTFSNATELQNISHKIVYYSDNPVTSTGELNDPLLAGEHLYDNPETWGADYLDLLIGHHEDNGYTTDGIPPTSTYTTMYGRDGTWDGSGSAIMAEMNSGHSFVHHVGHANSDYMMGLYTSDITNSNFSQLNGTTHNYALVYSHGCICGAFDDDDCISETMVKISNCAVGVFTNSRYGWFNEGQTEGPSAHLHREFVNALYHDKNNFAGMDELWSKYRTAPWVENPNEFEPGAQRWVFYDHNVLTDPALPIWTSNPFTPVVQYDNNLPLGADYTVTVLDGSTPLENYTCIIVQNGQIIGKALTNSNGQAVISVDLNHSDLGSATLIVSGYNILPQEFNINIIEATDAVLTLTHYDFSDDNNNLVDYDENSFLNLKIKNVGQQNATNVNITLSTSDTNINILNGQYQLSGINALDSAIIENIFEIKTGFVPDQYHTTITLTVNSDQYSFERQIPVTINAPKITIKKVNITEQSGNNDGYIQGGETASFSVTYENTGHAAIKSGTIELIPDYNLTITNNSSSFSALNAGDTLNFTTTLAVNSNVQDFTQIDIQAFFKTNFYGIQNTVSFITGKPVEDFETGDLSLFDWQTSGDANWYVEDSVTYDGTYSAHSGDITDEQESSLSLSVNTLKDGIISFYKKVSSENDFDYLKFYIDGQLQDKWSGKVDWSLSQYNLVAGNHTLKWTYSKDVSVSHGADAAYLDNISFPPLGSITGDSTLTDIKQQTASQNILLVYPQPFDDYVIFKPEISRKQSYFLEIYNLNGAVIYRKSGTITNGQKIYWNTDVNQGLYLYQLKIGNEMYQGKLLKK